MNISLSNVKNIELCYENCEVDQVKQRDLFGIYIKRRNKTSHLYKNKAVYSIKTFEIAFRNKNYKLRNDLAQLTIHYNDDTFDHFFIKWGDKDCSYDCSSLQKFHKNQEYVSLTSNCNSVF